MIEVNTFIEVDGKRIPITAQGFIGHAMKDEHVPSVHEWNEQLRRMREPIHCTGYLTNSEGNYQPTGPVVEGSIEPLQG